MRYKEMIELAQEKGLTSEKLMWESVEKMDKMLCLLKKEHPEEYWEFMREQHSVLWKGHYSEEFAEHDIKHLRYKDKEGKEHSGGYWSKEDVLEVTKGLAFPSGTNDCDKWVAYNVMYSDLHKAFDDEQILKAAYVFFFADDDFDYSKGSKIWEYTEAMK